jgi:hypothetical protein
MGKPPYPKKFSHMYQKPRVLIRLHHVLRAIVFWIITVIVIREGVVY